MHNRIDLLNPSTAIKQKVPSEKPSSILAILCLVCVIVTAGSYIFMFAMGRSMRAEADVVQKEIAALNEVEKELQVNSSLVQEKNKTTGYIEQMKAQRPILSKYLEEINKLIPSGASVTNLDIKYQPFSLTLKGKATSQLSVAQLGRNLQESTTFKECVVGSSQYASESKLTDFAITITPAGEGGNK